jgi:UDP-N-acetylmuramate-alanine ligase
MHELGGILKKYAKKDCYVLTMGAGSIGRVVRDVVAEIS